MGGGIYMDGGTTTWCKDNHAPKIIQKRATEPSDVRVCPECGNRFRVEKEVTVLDE